MHQNKAVPEHSDIEVDPNPFDPNFPPVKEFMNKPSSQSHKQTKLPKCMKVSECRIIASIYCFLLEKYKNIIMLSCGTTMEDIVIGIPGRHFNCWTTSANCNSIPLAYQNVEMQ